MASKSDTRNPRSKDHWWQSIRPKALLIILIMVLPLVLVGAFSIYYYQGVVRENIKSETLNTAKTVSAFTPFYMKSSQLYLSSIADRPSVVNAIKDNDRPFLHSMANYANATNSINSVYFADGNGIVLESTPELSSLVGTNSSIHPYVASALRGGETRIGEAEPGNNNMPVVPIALPVKDNNTVVGVLVGTVDMSELRKTIGSTVVVGHQQIYIVNRTGHVIVHTNSVYMEDMHNFSSEPIVQRLLLGETGVDEYYSQIYNQTALGAYAPVEPMGWGVVASYPSSVAYQPVWNTIWPMVILLTLFTLLALGLGLFLGNSLVAPILNISRATKAAIRGSDYKRLLPLSRRDEIGDLGRSFDDMVETVKRTEGELRRQAALAERERQRAVGERRRAELYMDIMSHDINNLNQLTAGYLEMIKDNSNLTDEQREMIMEALTASRGSSNIIDNVRTIQRIDEEKGEFQREDVNDMILECIRGAPKRDDIKITINYTPRKGLVIMGTALMKEVFCNLINNAVKHASRDVVVDVRVDETMRGGKKFYEVSVVDNGPGIPDDLKSRLFNRFQRGETKAYGKGLGLFIVKSLVEQAGGDVRVEDRVPGNYIKGARFIVSLPVCEECK